VVELYVGDPANAGEPPRQLKAFQKVYLYPGQSKNVTLRLDPSSFQTFDEATGSWKTTPGTYQIHVGSSSEHLPLRTSIAISG
jgi:beta-glucosidase